MAQVLDDILAYKRKEVEAAKAAVSPEVLCAACGLRIQPYDGRYVVQSASFHPTCYDQAQPMDGVGR